MKYCYETRMAVRDYECDIEGIVNNAKGVDAVVARMSLQYKVPLRPDDEFVSRLGLTKEGIKYVFHHDIYRASDEQLCFRGKVELVCLVNGRLGMSEEYDRAFANYIDA